MSLIHEALQKARREAAEQADASRTEMDALLQGPSGSSGPVAEAPRRGGALKLVAVALIPLVAVALWWTLAGSRGGPATEPMAAGATSPEITAERVATDASPGAAPQIDEPASAGEVPEIGQEEASEPAPVGASSVPLSTVPKQPVPEQGPTAVAPTSETAALVEPAEDDSPPTEPAVSVEPSASQISAPAAPDSSFEGAENPQNRANPVSVISESDGDGGEGGDARGDLPKLIEPPEIVGQVAEDVYVLEAELDGAKLVLDFIVWSPPTPFAQINGKQVEVGQSVDGFVVVAVEKDRVTLQGARRRAVLRIR